MNPIYLSIIIKRKKLLVSLFVGLLAIKSLGQIAKTTIVETSLDQASFQAVPLPFDEPFIISGPSPQNCFLITFEYEVKDGKKKWMTFPEKNKGYSTWHKTDSNRYSLKCEGMHPNVTYIFTFNIFRNLVIDDKTKAELKKNLSDRLIEFGKKFSDKPFAKSDEEKLNSDLTKILGDQLKITCLGSSLRSKCNPAEPYPLDIRINDLLRPEFEKFVTAQEKLGDSYKDLWGAGTRIFALKNEMNSVNGQLLQDIDAVLSGKLKLNKLSRELLQLPFTPSLPDFKSHTLLQGITILRKMLVPSQNMNAFLDGKLQIKNTNLEEIAQVDYNSLYFFDALLRYLAAGVIRDTINHREVARFSALNAIHTNVLDDVLSALKKHEAAKKSVETLVNNFPDISAEIVLADALTFEQVSIPDVVSEKSPYISVEAGISYSSSFAMALHYAGANFYFSPVNKKTPLSKFHGWNLVRKMVCFNLAIGNFFGTRPQNTYSLLGQSSGSDLMVGLGLRLGRVVKLNAHWLPYKTDNTNTLAKDKSLKGDFLISLGADINIIKGLGSMGKALNLIE